MPRRSFLCTGLAVASASPLVARDRQFYSAFVPGSLGVSADQARAIDLAQRHGFDAVQPFPSDLLRDGVAVHVDALRKHGLRWAAAGLGVQFRNSEAEFASGMEALDSEARVLAEAGVDRVGTWLMPSSDDLTYLQNFRRTGRRLREIAGALGSHGLRLGLEYVGTKRNWTAKRHSFVHTMAGTLELIEEIGLDNVGVVLDSWHWWTSRETGGDIRKLSAADVVSVDLNDAPAGLARDEQYDNRRELPLATGVIGLAEFLEALVAIGYDGPVRAEPFSRKLSDMEDEDASRLSGEALRAAFRLVD